MDCPFCKPDPTREPIASSALAYAIFDKYPVSEGHALIIPKIHEPAYFQLPVNYQQACWQLLNEVQTIIRHQYQPDGFNVGININDAAGQTVPHVHIHLIPRYIGDVEDAVGGVRGVIPARRRY